MKDNIHELARGRWRSILMAAGFNETVLSGKHGPCPLCGGKDRWRWTNHENGGSGICNACGPKTGVDLVMAILKLQFADARKFILEQIGKAPVETTPKRNNEQGIKRLSKLWLEANRLSGDDPASLYLAKRGITLAEYPTQLRYHSRVAYLHDDKSLTYHPALLSKFVSPDAKTFTLHTTFLDMDGNKAALPKVKKLAPVSVPLGGAVRLGNSAETMGIAEGIETALSAHQMFDVPVWAALSTGCLLKWEPPTTAKNILIFADYDEGFAGQAAAYPLAHKLAAKGFHVEVRMPPDLGDWNDVLAAEKEFA